ncbi:hypothetical protein QL285_044976 [Trifolium repens]|nr:hypothetical protein QL285_044976 [Trifolium repens]
MRQTKNSSTENIYPSSTEVFCLKCMQTGTQGNRKAGDDRNFYGIFSSIISSKMTKTSPNTKKNLQKQEKASRQSPRCKKTRKSPKSEEIQHSIAARCVPSCHDESMLARKEIRRNNS